jgi:hypothetical protein
MPRKLYDKAQLQYMCTVRFLRNLERKSITMVSEATFYFVNEVKMLP